MKTSDNTIIKVVIPRWVEAELKGSNISQILTAYANDKKHSRETNSNVQNNK
jgi:hypothetical protein